MTSKSEHSDQTDAALKDEMDNILFPGIAAAAPPQRLQAITSRLEQRVSRSIVGHAGIMTVRWKDGAWKNLTKGIRTKQLRQGALGNSVLIEFAPGASLPVHRHNWIEEGIVLKGGLQMGALNLGLFDYHLSPAGSRHDRIQSKEGALAYLRGTAVGHSPSVLKELLGGLLPFQGGTSQTVFFQDAKWRQIKPGVKKLELFANGQFASAFYQLAADATLGRATDRLSEEWMILSGEVFIGDILLCAGEYLQSPPGRFYGEVSTDVGAILFVREVAE